MTVKPETIFWRDTVRPALRDFGTLHRIENAVEVGMPDVVACLSRGDGKWCSSWIELKRAWEWPVREKTIFRFKHYTVDQANFLNDWNLKRQRTCLLAQINDEYLLVSGKHAQELQRGVTRDRFYKIASVHGQYKFPTARVLMWLTDG